MKENSQDSIDRFFRERMEEGESQLPLESWNSIQQKLSDRGYAATPLKVKRNVNYRWAVAASLLLLMNIGGWMVYHENQNKQHATLYASSLALVKAESIKIRNQHEVGSPNKYISSPEKQSNKLQDAFRVKESPGLVLPFQDFKAPLENVNTKKKIGTAFLSKGIEQSKILTDAGKITAVANFRPSANAIPTKPQDLTNIPNRGFIPLEGSESERKGSAFLDVPNKKFFPLVSEQFSFQNYTLTTLLPPRNIMALPNQVHSILISKSASALAMEDTGKTFDQSFQIPGKENSLVANFGLASKPNTFNREHTMIASKSEDNKVLPNDTLSANMVADTNYLAAVNELLPTDLSKDTKTLTPAPAKSHSRYSLGLFALPGISAVTHIAEGETKAPVKKQGFRNVMDAALLLNMHLTKRLSVSSGLMLSTFMERTTVFETKAYRDTTEIMIVTPTTFVSSSRMPNSYSNNQVSTLQDVYPDKAQKLIVDPTLQIKQYKFKDSLVTTGSQRTNVYQYVGIPIQVGYALGSKKICVKVSSGLVLNIPVSGKTVVKKTSNNFSNDIAERFNYATANNSSMDSPAVPESDRTYTSSYIAYSDESHELAESKKMFETAKLRNFNIMYLVGIDCQWSLTNNIALSAGLLFRQALHSVVSTKGIKTLPYSAGLQFGVLYHL